MESIDFYEAGTLHIKWERRLNAFIDGKKDLAESEIVKQKDCRLEKWLRSEGMSKYRNMIEVKELDRAHTQYHNMFDRVIKFKQAGDTDLAKQELEKLNSVLKQLVGVLSALGARVD